MPSICSSPGKLVSTILHSPVPVDIGSRNGLLQVLEIQKPGMSSEMRSQWMYLVFHILRKHVLHAGATDAQYVLRMHPMCLCADIVRGYALCVLNYAYVEHRITDMHLLGTSMVKPTINVLEVCTNIHNSDRFVHKSCTNVKKFHRNVQKIYTSVQGPYKMMQNTKAGTLRKRGNAYVMKELYTVLHNSALSTEFVQIPAHMCTYLGSCAYLRKRGGQICTSCPLGCTGFGLQHTNARKTHRTTDT
jgi:hypothetical protein